MSQIGIRVCVVLAVLVIGVHKVTASPRYRIKRVSDAHLADLETRIALNNKVKGVAITMPIGGGRFDPSQIGRRRRSESRFLDILFNQSEEDRGDPELSDYTNLLQRLRDLQ